VHIQLYKESSCILTNVLMYILISVEVKYLVFLCILKAHLLHPTLIDLCLQFYSTTAQWMVNLVLSSSDGQDLPIEVY